MGLLSLLRAFPQRQTLLVCACCSLPRLPQSGEPVHKSRGSAKSLHEASMLPPSSCTPKTCLFCIEMVKGRLGSH